MKVLQHVEARDSVQGLQQSTSPWQELVSWEQHAKMLAAELEAVPLVFQNRKVLT